LRPLVSSHEWFRRGAGQPLVVGRRPGPAEPRPRPDPPAQTSPASRRDAEYPAPR